MGTRGKSLKNRAFDGLWGGLIALGMAACGPTPTPLPAATEILEQSAQAMQRLSSVHFYIERTGALAYVDEANTIAFRRAEGDYAAPDQARATVRVVAPALVADVSVVSLGGDYWETNPVTGQWANYPGLGYNPARLFNAETGLTTLMRNDLEQLTLLGLEENPDFPGEKLFHLTAEAPGTRLLAMTANLIGRGRVQFEFWIAPDTFYVRQLQVIEPDTDLHDPTVWLLEFEAFNKPVVIEKPEGP
jgi:hypothetical protein